NAARLEKFLESVFSIGCEVVVLAKLLLRKVDAFERVLLHVLTGGIQLDVEAAVGSLFVVGLTVFLLLDGTEVGAGGKSRRTLNLVHRLRKKGSKINSHFSSPCYPRP